MSKQKSTLEQIDEIAEKLRYSCYYVNYHEGKSQEQLNFEIESHVEGCKQKLHNLMESEKTKLCVQLQVEAIDPNINQSTGSLDTEKVAIATMKFIESGYKRKKAGL